MKRLSCAVLGALLVLPTAAAAQARQDPRGFLRQAIQGDDAEVRLGHLAEGRGHDPGVVRFGRVLAHDHYEARARAERLAQRYHLPARLGAAPQARREYTRLLGLRGDDFDREFVRYMVEDHRKDVATFRAEAGRQGAVARLAGDTLPTLEKHLSMAEDLQRALAG